MRMASTGHAMFAATVIAVGILGLVKGDLNVWGPVPKGVPASEVLGYLCAFIPVACGVGLLQKRTAAAAARGLLAYLLIWMFVFRVPGLLHGLTVDVYWSLCQTAVHAGGCLGTVRLVCRGLGQAAPRLRHRRQGSAHRESTLWRGYNPVRPRPFSICRTYRFDGAELAAGPRGMGVF